MKVYTAKSVARLLDLSVQQVRSYARAGFLQPDRGPRGEYRFSFQDLVMLRTAKGLMAARIPTDSGSARGSLGDSARSDVPTRRRPVRSSGTVRCGRVLVVFMVSSLKRSPFFGCDRTLMPPLVECDTH